MLQLLIIQLRSHEHDKCPHPSSSSLPPSLSPTYAPSHTYLRTHMDTLTHTYTLKRFQLYSVVFSCIQQNWPDAPSCPGGAGGGFVLWFSRSSTWARSGPESRGLDRFLWRSLDPLGNRWTPDPVDAQITKKTFFLKLVSNLALSHQND